MFAIGLSHRRGEGSGGEKADRDCVSNSHFVGVTGGGCGSPGKQGTCKTQKEAAASAVKGVKSSVVRGEGQT
jgi:hypothetical protein